eukprot:scaffold14697_cov118-Skeletonema_marinoi.AAC.2
MHFQLKDYFFARNNFSEYNMLSVTLWSFVKGYKELACIRMDSPPAPFPMTKSPPWTMKPGTTRCMVDDRYVNALPDSPIGAGFGFFGLLHTSNELPPLTHRVAKFSQAKGATSQ